MENDDYEIMNSDFKISQTETKMETDNYEIMNSDFKISQTETETKIKKCPLCFHPKCNLLCIKPPRPDVDVDIYKGRFILSVICFLVRVFSGQ